ncbi:MAG: hypothetical protein WBO34_05075 [Gammaproteobacteria bacterium]
MKKTALATALAVAVGTAGIAEAGTAGLTGVWTGSYVFTMYDPGGGFVGDSGAPQPWTFDFNAGTVDIVNTSTFYTSVWSAHDVTFGDNGDGTYSGSMLFDWSVNANIPVNITWDICGSCGNVATITSAITAGSPVFPGFQPFFDGSISQIPIPAAAYLFGSGLLGLAGVARRRRRR